MHCALARPLCALPADLAVSTGEPGEDVGVSSELRLGDERVKASRSWEPWCITRVLF